MTKMLQVHYDSHTDNLGGYDPEDEWSRDSTRSTYYPTHVTISPSQYGDCPISDCEVGDKVYLVWADYQTGDTFGSDSAVEFLAAFKHKGYAHRCVDQANLSKKGNSYNWSINVKLDGGEQYTVNIPWLGYFEHLEEVHVTELEVRA